MKRSPPSSPVRITLKTTWMLLALFPTAPAFAEDKLHEEVVAALEWELPVNECTKPRSVDRYSLRSDGDVDFSTIDRYKLKEKRWKKYLANYKEGLMRGFELLNGNVQHGLT